MKKRSHTPLFAATIDDDLFVKRTYFIQIARQRDTLFFCCCCYCSRSKHIKALCACETHFSSIKIFNKRSVLRFKSIYYARCTHAHGARSTGHGAIEHRTRHTEHGVTTVHRLPKPLPQCLEHKSSDATNTMDGPTDCRSPRKFHFEYYISMSISTANIEHLFAIRILGAFAKLKVENNGQALARLLQMTGIFMNHGRRFFTNSIFSTVLF